MGYDVVSNIIQYETEGLSLQQEAKLYRHLLKTGMIYSLQGAYQRRCQELIDNGTIKVRRRGRIMTHTTKHTPGPWVVRPDSTIESKDGVTIASFVDNEADMSIISAAPVMYADLCAVRDYLFELYDEGNAKAGEYAASLGITIEQAEGQHHE